MNRHHSPSRVLGAGALAVASAFALTACAPSKSADSGGGGSDEVPDTIVIGSTLPLTGSESKTGGRYKQGYELAVEQVNANGGIDLGGKKVKVELKLLDDTSDQAKAVNLAQRLITSDGVDAFLGTYSTSLVEAQSTVAEQNQIPYVNGGGAATSIYSKGYKWVFGTLAPVENLATTEMEWIDEQQKAGKLPSPAKVAVLYENTSHGEDFDKGVNEFAKKSGTYDIVVEESFALDGKDFSAVLNKVKSANADLFLVDAHVPDFIAMHRQYLSSGMCNQIITYGARGTEQDAKEALGQEGVNYILSAVWWNAQLGDKGLNKTFVESFKEKYDGAEPEWYQAVSYEAARALFTAIDQADSVDKTKVRDQLNKLEMDSIMPGGTLSFPADKGGQASYPFVVQQNLPDGTSPIIYPADVATGEGVAPNPSCAG